MQSKWQRSARRLALRVNLGWALSLGAPRLGAGCLVAAAVGLVLRKAGLMPLLPLLVSAGLLVVALGWTVKAAWPRRYREAHALSRLDDEAGLGGALLSAAEGVAPWPDWRKVQVGLRWRLGRVWPGLVVAPLVLAAALLVPIEEPAASPSGPTAPPISWQRLQEALQILEEEEPLVEPAELDRWQAQLDALEARPPEEWFDEENLEAADAVFSELRRTVARAEQAIAPVERALEDAGRAVEDVSRRAAQSDLQDAMKGLEQAGAQLDPELAKKLTELDPAALPSMSTAERDALRSQLARARAAGRRALAEEAEGAQEEGEEGAGGVERGPGTAPIQLTPNPARRLSERADEFDSARDPARDALSDVVRVDAVAPEVDQTSYTGPTRVDGTENLGEGGQAVWRLVLDPDEQALLERYFE